MRFDWALSVDAFLWPDALLADLRWEGGARLGPAEFRNRVRMSPAGRLVGGVRPGPADDGGGSEGIGGSGGAGEPVGMFRAALDNLTMEPQSANAQLNKKEMGRGKICRHAENDARGTRGHSLRRAVSNRNANYKTDICISEHQDHIHHLFVGFGSGRIGESS